MKAWPNNITIPFVAQFDEEGYTVTDERTIRTSILFRSCGSTNENVIGTGETLS